MMRSSVLALFLFLVSTNTSAQSLPAGTPRIKHEALEINNDMAYYKGKPYTGISLTFWDNKHVNEQFSWKDGLKDGVYKEYTEDGILVTQVTWYQGEKSGPYTYNYPNGAKQSEGNFLHNDLDGEILGYYTNGILKYRNHYTSGMRNGSSQTWFANGAPEQVSNFVNDLPDGLVQAFYPDSLTRYLAVYSMGIRNGKYYMYNKLGCMAEESYYKNGKLDSIRRYWSEINCSLLQEENYLNGQLHGQAAKYDVTGDTLSLETYKYGKLNGLYKEWKTMNEAVSVSRKKHEGPAHLYTTDRGIEVIGYYIDGQPSGYWKYGLLSHYQQREGNYDNGTMVGEWIFYDNNGKLLMRQWYDDEGNVTKEKHYRRSKK